MSEKSNQGRIARATEVIRSRDRAAGSAAVRAAQEESRQRAARRNELAQQLPREVQQTLDYLDENGFPGCRDITVKRKMKFWGNQRNDVRKNVTEPGWTLMSTGPYDADTNDGYTTTTSLLVSGDFIVDTTHTWQVRSPSYSTYRYSSELMVRRYPEETLRAVLEKVVALREA